jgi:hypothetical protein
MTKALVIEDLDMSKELDRAALAKVVGGRNTYGAGSWVRSQTGTRIGNAWKRNPAAGAFGGSRGGSR